MPFASVNAIDLVSSLCSWDPCKRPTALEALQHPFFQSCFYIPPSLRCKSAVARTPPSGTASLYNLVFFGTAEKLANMTVGRRRLPTTQAFPAPPMKAGGWHGQFRLEERSPGKRWDEDKYCRDALRKPTNWSSARLINNAVCMA
ncbi:cyclin-dependent kinase [Sarracenia purpurea var. burkii]